MSRHVEHIGSCRETGKVRFANEHDAKKALGKAKSLRRHRRGSRIESRYYACERCGGYHLTATSRREYEARTAGGAE